MSIEWRYSQCCAPVLNPDLSGWSAMYINSDIYVCTPLNQVECFCLPRSTTRFLLHYPSYFTQSTIQGEDDDATTDGTLWLLEIPN